MTDEMTLEDMYEELHLNYVEMYHEDSDVFDPDGYSEYLDKLSDEELIELYNDTFDY
jgi:hypothetical protein